MKSLMRLSVLGVLALSVSCAGQPNDSDDDDSAPIEPSYCEVRGYSEAPFQTDDGGSLFGDLAEDFTVNQLDGTSFSLSKSWTGCESHIFFSYFAFSNPNSASRMNQIWESDIAGIIEASDPNVHYFYVSDESSSDDRVARMEVVQERLEEALDALFQEDEGQRAEWASRFHLVTDELSEVEGSVGDFVSDFISYSASADPVDLGDRGDAYAPYPLTFAIGRDQRWDPTGNWSEYVGGPSNLKMIAYNSGFYNHRAELQARLEAEEATEVLPVIDELVTSRLFYRDVIFPDAATMMGYDTFEIDVEVTCLDRNPFACSEWDRIARIGLCVEVDKSDPESCIGHTELVRWITPYWRRGRRHWVMDASPFLALVQGGGTQRLRVEMGPTWERATERKATMSVRLSNQSKGTTSSNVDYAFGGGTFNADYNDGREAFIFTPPADAERVELVTIISGHGQSDGNNCAEWCNHMHTFSVNQSTDSQVVSYSGIGAPVGCAERSGEGVVPGQWGNWSQSRAGWCPGLPVETVRFDITDQVVLGEENSLYYVGSYQGGTPAGGSISKSTYVVSYEPS
jgi:hypothetical protein